MCGRLRRDSILKGERSTPERAAIRGEAEQGGVRGRGKDGSAGMDTGENAGAYSTVVQHKEVQAATLCISKTWRFAGGSEGGGATLPFSSCEAKSGESTPESFRVTKDLQTNSDSALVAQPSTD